MTQKPNWWHPACKIAVRIESIVFRKHQPKSETWTSLPVARQAVCAQLPSSAVNVTLLAFASDRRAAADVDRKAAAPAAERRPCSNRSTSPAGSKPTAAACGAECRDRQTDGRTPCRFMDPENYQGQIERPLLASQARCSTNDSTASC